MEKSINYNFSQVAISMLIYWAMLIIVYILIALAGYESYVAPILVAIYVTANYFVKKNNRTLYTPEAFTIGLFGLMPILFVVLAKYPISFASEKAIKGSLLVLAVAFIVYLINSVAIKAYTDRLITKKDNDLVKERT